MYVTIINLALVFHSYDYVLLGDYGIENGQALQSSLSVCFHSNYREPAVQYIDSNCKSVQEEAAPCNNFRKPPFLQYNTYSAKTCGTVFSSFRNLSNHFD